MNIGIVRLSEKPLVALVSNGQLIFAKEINKDNLLNNIHNCFCGIDLQDLLVYVKPSLLEVVPKGALKFSTYKVGPTHKHCALALSDKQHLNDLITILGIDTVSLYSCYNYYKHIGEDRDIIIIDTFDENMYILSFIKNNTIMDIRKCIFSSLEKTLTQMMSTYNVKDIYNVNKNYSRINIEPALSNFEQVDKSDRYILDFISFVLLNTCDKSITLSETIEDAKGSDIMSALCDEGGQYDDYGQDVNLDNYGNNNAYMRTLDKDPKRPKNKKSRRLPFRWFLRKSVPKVNAIGNENIFSYHNINTSDGKVERNNLSRTLTSSAMGLMFGVLVVSMILSTVYRGKAVKEGNGIENLVKMVASQKVEKKNIKLFTGKQTPLDKLYSIQDLKIPGVIEELRYKNDNSYIIVATKETSDLGTCENQINSICKISSVKKLSTTDISGVTYTKYRLQLEL